jgi:WD40 repeat protein
MPRWQRDRLELSTGASLLNVKDSCRFPRNLAFSPDSKRLAWASERRVRLWDIDAEREVRVFDDAGAYTGPLAFSPDGQLCQRLRDCNASRAKE